MNLFFDPLIFLYLIASATFAAAIFRDRKIPGKWEYRHPKLVVGCSVVLLFSFLVVIWGSFIEPRLITVKPVQIDLPNFEPTKPVRVALISDVHVGTYKKAGWVRRVSERIAKERPDLIFIAGDLIVSKPEHAQYLSSLKLLASSFPTYAVLGDHDYHVIHHPFSIDEELARTVEKTLTDTGVDVLRNETRAIAVNGAPFTLVGLDDWMAGKTDFSKAISQLPNHLSTYVPTLVIIHNPDFILAEESKNADLILAGNTHGGQIRLPIVGPLPRLPSKLPRSFDEGLFDLQYTEALPPRPRSGRQGLLFITSGISESGPRARLFNPPEIAILELH